MKRGGHNLKNLSGKEFGSLKVVRQLESNRQGFARWECLCECGKTIVFSGASLRKGRKSCGCKNYKHSGVNNPNWCGFGQISGSFWKRIRSSAIDRQINFDIIIEDAWNQFEKQGGKCALTGIEIKLCTSHAIHRKDLNLQTASLDRIDSSKGYTKDNIQWVHKDIQRMKSTLEVNRFIELCSMVHFHKGNQSG